MTTHRDIFVILWRQGTSSCLCAIAEYHHYSFLINSISVCLIYADDGEILEFHADVVTFNGAFYRQKHCSLQQ